MDISEGVPITYIRRTRTITCQNCGVVKTGVSIKYCSRSCAVKAAKKAKRLRDSQKTAADALTPEVYAA